MRIFITGCAKSGTTLLRRLFWAFKDIYVIDHEVSLFDFLSIPAKDGYLVGKRSYGDIFSASLADGNLLKAVSFLLRYPSIKIVNIYRDGRDVVESGETPGRWISCIRQMLRYSNLISLNVRYEHLVTNPDSIQSEISRELKLESDYKFSEYPRFFTVDEVSGMQKYRPKPIIGDRIGKNLEIYKKRLRNNSEKYNFENLLKNLGYIND